MSWLTVGAAAEATDTPVEGVRWLIGAGFLAAFTDTDGVTWVDPDDVRRQRAGLNDAPVAETLRNVADPWERAGVALRVMEALQSEIADLNDVLVGAVAELLHDGHEVVEIAERLACAPDVLPVPDPAGPVSEGADEADAGGPAEADDMRLAEDDPTREGSAAPSATVAAPSAGPDADAAGSPEDLVPAALAEMESPAGPDADAAGSPEDLVPAALAEIEAPEAVEPVRVEDVVRPVDGDGAVEPVDADGAVEPVDADGAVEAVGVEDAVEPGVEPAPAGVEAIPAAGAARSGPVRAVGPWVVVDDIADTATVADAEREVEARPEREVEAQADQVHEARAAREVEAGAAVLEFRRAAGDDQPPLRWVRPVPPSGDEASRPGPAAVDAPVEDQPMSTPTDDEGPGIGWGPIDVTAIARTVTSDVEAIARDVTALARTVTSAVGRVLSVLRRR